MKTRYRFTAGIIGFLLTLLVALSGQPSLGFDVVGQITGKPQELTYSCNDKKYLVRVLPIRKLNPEEFISVNNKYDLLKGSGKPLLQNYHFEAAKRPLDASFNIEQYRSFMKGCSDQVGAEIRVNYKAVGGWFKGTDPSLDLHWIQVVTDSAEHSSTPPSDILSQPVNHPAGIPFLDLGNFFFYPGISDPYYPTVGKDPLNSSISMWDAPTRPPATARTWTAQLYLAQKLNPIPGVGNNIKIFNGIEWGFEIIDDIDAPCNQTNNQNKSEDKQDNNSDKNQCSPAVATTNGDPHLTTFDGLKYDLQTLGEFTLVKSHRSNFEVQVRQIPWNNSGSISTNSAAAVKMGSDRVAVYAQGLPDADTTTPLRVNGKPTTIQGDKLALPGGGEILRQGGNYVMSAPTGEKVLVSSAGSYLNLSPIVDNRAGKYSGLLGNVNGSPKDDLQVRDGKNVLEARSTYGDVKQVINLVGLRLPGVLDRAEQAYFDQLYKQFANSWRVKQEESLFDYPPGKTTKSYLNPGFPDKYLTLNMLSADQIQKAQKACTEANVTPDLMEGCIFDVGFSGFSGFARTTAEISGYIGIVNQLLPGLNIPTPEQAVNRLIEKVKPKVCLPFVGCI